MAKAITGHVDLDTREAAAPRLLGFASSALATAESSALISELIASVSGRHKLRFEAHMEHYVQYDM
ncbi:unnamed protein product [Prunus armeniaca]|uniref:Uncharacterized protein n=1 Tax=Prunus armeniaca TaxID=36596 RepID=A0A6J5UPT4_PRUAR|nr:unnamed protein product [Prunus armeniaca]